MAEPKILLYDLENSPIIGAVWEMFEANVNWVERDWHLMSYSAKWLGQKKVITKALCDFPSYKRNKYDDKALVKSLWELLNEADIIIAHNGDAFDKKKAYSRFLFHGFDPPQEAKTIDTLKIARRRFKNASNKLDALGEMLGVGRKLPNTGSHLWRSCLNGDMKAWREMKAYNEQDVLLLERVYLKLRPWDTSHPNLNIFSGKEACPRCQHTHFMKQGRVMLASGKIMQRYTCINCGGWIRRPVTDEKKLPSIKTRI